MEALEVKVDFEQKIATFGPLTYGGRLFDLFKAAEPKDYLELITQIKGYETLGAVEDYLIHFELREGDTVLDCGGHVGVNTAIFAAKVGPKGKVIVLEPDTRALGCNMSNNYNYKNITYIPVGAWDKKTTSIINQNGWMGVSNVVYSFFSDMKPSPVRLDRVDDLLKELGIKKINFIKMDIEAAEIQAVKGMEETLKNCDGFNIAAYHQILDENNDTRRTIQYVEPWLKKHLPKFNIKIIMGHDGEQIVGWQNEDRLI